MRLMTISRALLVRTLFACHGIMAIWRLFMVTQQLWCWYLSAALFGLFIETLITIAKKKGKEWKWFCPSVFFYLASVVPAIWFLELHEMERRIDVRENLAVANTTNVTMEKETVTYNETEDNLRLNVEELGFELTLPMYFCLLIYFELTLPISLPSDLWLRVLEQFLLLMLIIGRWILPKGAISHDQLSQLLLVYVGTAADIVEFYEAFSEDEVKYNRLLCYIILGIWTLSLMQFTLVLTATKARRDQVGLPMTHDEFDDVGTCCNPELYGIMTSIMLQDLPFLVVRLMLIFKYHVVSYTNMFFTSKNSVVITLLIYRLIVVHTEARKKRNKRKLSSMPISSLNDINANGQKNYERPLRKDVQSRSNPAMNHIASSETLPRMKKKGNSNSKSLPNAQSDTNIRNHLITPKRGEQRKRSPSPRDKK